MSIGFAEANLSTVPRPAKSSARGSSTSAYAISCRYRRQSLARAARPRDAGALPVESAAYKAALPTLYESRRESSAGLFHLWPSPMLSLQDTSTCTPGFSP